MGGENETVAPANCRRRRRFRGLAKMAAAVSAATTSTSTNSTITIATASAARPLARDGNWRLEMRRSSRASAGRCPKRKAGWEV